MQALQLNCENKTEHARNHQDSSDCVTTQDGWNWATGNAQSAKSVLNWSSVILQFQDILPVGKFEGYVGVGLISITILYGTFSAEKQSVISSQLRSVERTAQLNSIRKS